MKKSEEEVRSKWLRWLGELGSEAGEILSSREIYIEVRNIIASNPEIKANNRLYHWMSINYIHTAVIRVRRLLDKDPRSVSLVRLLNSMKEHRHLLTREAHVALYTNEPIELQANGTFDRLAGENERIYPEERLSGDLKNLDGLWTKVEPFANKRISHLDDVSDIGPLPKFSDLDAVIDEIERQLKKYCLLLEAKTYISLQPVPQWDWKAVLRVPWIAEGR